MAKTEVLGIGDMRVNYGRVREDMRTRTSRRMLVAGGTVLKRKAKVIALANGSRRSGAMIANIAIKREADAPAGTEQYHLGVRHGRNLTAKNKKAGKRLAVNGRGRVVVRYVDDPYYWRWVELGHKVTPRAAVADGTTVYQQRLPNGKIVTREKKYSGKSIRQRRKHQTKTIPAKPFIAPALEQGRAEAVQAMNAKLAEDLKKVGRP